MPNNALLLLAAGAALWFLRNQGGEEEEVDQLTASAMMASGEGTAPNAPFVSLAMPSDPVFFFNQGGEMAQTPDSGVPTAARSGEDIGQHISGKNQPELEFEVQRSDPPPGTSDISPTTPQFAGGVLSGLVPSTLWDDPIAIAEANKMPLLAIQDTGSWDIGTGGIKILGANVDISTLSSKEGFRAVQVNPDGTPSLGALTGGFTTDADTLSQYVQGFIETPEPGAQLFDYFNQPARGSAADPSASDEDRGRYPGGGDPGELEFQVQRSLATGTSDISPTTPEFSPTQPPTMRTLEQRSRIQTLGWSNIGYDRVVGGGFDLDDPW